MWRNGVFLCVSHVPIPGRQGPALSHHEPLGIHPYNLTQNDQIRNNNAYGEEVLYRSQSILCILGFSRACVQIVQTLISTVHSSVDAPKLMSKSSHNQQWRYSQYRNCALCNLPLSWLVTAASSKFSRYVSNSSVMLSSRRCAPSDENGNLNVSS